MRRIAFVLIALCLATNALAWGESGHRIVCRIAYLELSHDEQLEVIRLTKAFEAPDGTTFKYFTDGCVFPDQARANAKNGVEGFEIYDQFNNQHFINLPRDAESVTIEECHNDCVLSGIMNEASALKTGADDQAKSEALFFLGHFVGDVHQPLHVSYADDLGGNNIKPIKGNFYSSKNLHSVWDGGIIAKAMGNKGWRIYADELQQDITDAQRAEWKGRTPIDWAQESYEITILPDLLYCKESGGECKAISQTGRTLKKPYQQKFQDDVEGRLRRAGVRLAEEIHKALSE